MRKEELLGQRDLFLSLAPVQGAVRAYTEGVNILILHQPRLLEEPHEVGGRKVAYGEVVGSAVVAQEDDGGRVKRPLLFEAVHEPAELDVHIANDVKDSRF